MAHKTSEIKFMIDLDKDNITENIRWQASDGGNHINDSKSIMISIWDSENKNTLKIDLWTKDLRLDEMDNHFFQTLIATAETYQKATKTDFVVDDMKNFCKMLAEKINIKEKEKGQ